MSGRADLPGARAHGGAAVPLPALGEGPRAAGRRLHGGDPGPFHGAPFNGAPFNGALYKFILSIIHFLTLYRQ